MAHIQTDASAAAHADVWHSILLEVSPHGIQRLVLQDAAQEPVVPPHAETSASALLDQARGQLAEYFHGCQHERRVQEGNRIHFASCSAALEAGYRPCKVCQPVFQDA